MKVKELPKKAIFAYGGEYYMKIAEPALVYRILDGRLFSMVPTRDVKPLRYILRVLGVDLAPRCANHVGLPCVNGECPNIGAVQTPCGECALYKGCEDCMFNDKYGCTSEYSFYIERRHAKE